MIEVLVALLVMSFGLLAVARLSAAALVHQKSAQMRLTSVTLAQQYAERARLNVYGFDLGLYDLDLNTASPDTATALDSDASDEVAALGVAVHDRSGFQRLVAVSLPDGAAQVTSRPGARTRELDIWLLWRDATIRRDDAIARHQCPAALGEGQRDGRSCMHLRVSL